MHCNLCCISDDNDDDDDPRRYKLVSSYCPRPRSTPKTQPNGAVRCRLDEFVAFKSIHRLKSLPSDAGNLVGFLLWGS